MIQICGIQPLGIYYGYPKNFPTKENPNLKPIINGITHTYKEPGKYSISIVSKKDTVITNYRCDTLYVHINDTYTWRNLIAIYSLGNLKWKSFENSFCNAVKLATIPNENLILANNDYTEDNTDLIFNVSHMFYNCKSISNIPMNFKLHKNLIDMSYMFYNCFNVCITNAGFKPGMMPSNGFYNSTTNINVTSMFENCKAMTGKPQSRLLWYSPFNTWLSNNCYAGCTSLSDWKYIPVEWGGGGYEEPFVFQIKFPNKRADNKYQITLPIVHQLEHWNSRGTFFSPAYIYNFRVDWGDNSEISNIKNWQDLEKTHIYETYGMNDDGIFEIKIYGLFEGWDTYNSSTVTGDYALFRTLLYKIINWR